MVRRSKCAFIPFLIFLSSFFQMAYAQTRSPEKIVPMCQQCHGANLEGNAPVLAPAIAGLPAWYTEAQLVKFRNDIRGKHPRDIGGMKMRPLMLYLRNDEEAKLLGEYIEKLPKNPAAQTVTGDVSRGKERYALCQSCHGENAQGIKELNAPPLTISDDWYYLTQLKNFKIKARGGDAAADPIGNQMIAIAATLEDEQVMKDIIAYINTLR
jgi:cytochrome c553